MSLSSTPTLKAYLTSHLGPVLSSKYFSTLNAFFNGKISRDEFSDEVHGVFGVFLREQAERAEEEERVRVRMVKEEKEAKEREAKEAKEAKEAEEARRREEEERQAKGEEGQVQGQGEEGLPTISQDAAEAPAQTLEDGQPADLQPKEEVQDVEMQSLQPEPSEGNGTVDNATDTQIPLSSQVQAQDQPSTSTSTPAIAVTPAAPLPARASSAAPTAGTSTQQPLKNGPTHLLASARGATAFPGPSSSAPLPPLTQSQSQSQSQSQASTSGNITNPTTTTTPHTQPPSDDRLIQIHNALIISLFDATTHHRRSGLLGVIQQSHAQNQAALAARSGLSLSSLPFNGGLNGTGPGGAFGAEGEDGERKRKRRRVVRGDGTDETGEEGVWSEKMRRWAVGLGRGERERVKALAVDSAAAAAASALSGVPPPLSNVDPNSTGGGDDPPPPPAPHPPPLHLPPPGPTPSYLSEVSQPRALPTSLTSPPVLTTPTHPHSDTTLRRPISLCIHTRAPTIQHIADRVNLISAQHDLGAPGKDVSALLLLALEAKVKQLVTHAMTLTMNGLSIQSIPPPNSSEAFYNSNSNRNHTSSASSSHVLGIDALDTLFTIAPSDLPHASASVMTRLALGDEREDDDGGDLAVVRDREVSDERWQMMALLAERSAVREVLQAGPGRRR